jgi:hypothetical protein
LAEKLVLVSYLENLFRLTFCRSITKHVLKQTKTSNIKSWNVLMITVSENLESLLAYYFIKHRRSSAYTLLLLTCLYLKTYSTLHLPLIAFLIKTQGRLLVLNNLFIQLVPNALFVKLSLWWHSTQYNNINVMFVWKIY